MATNRALMFYDGSGEKKGSVHSTPDGTLVIEVGSSNLIETLKLKGKDLEGFLSFTRGLERDLKRGVIGADSCANSEDDDDSDSDSDSNCDDCESDVTDSVGNTR